MKGTFNIGMSNNDNQPLIDGEWYKIKANKSIVDRLTVNIRGKIASFSLEN
jgi:hypothetical protein